MKTIKRNPYLRVKLKSLAEESRIIRNEKNRLKNSKHPLRSKYINGLHWHRIDVVRVEARATLLAYQYLRGFPYSVCESNPKHPPDWSKVASMVRRYGGIKDFDHKSWLRGDNLKQAA